MKVEINKNSMYALTLVGAGLFFRLLGKGEANTPEERIRQTGDQTSLKGSGNLLIIIGSVAFMASIYNNKK